MTDRKVVVEEGDFRTGRKLPGISSLERTSSTKLYRVCADYQGGKTVTYKKSKLLDRYDQVCESSREVSE